MKSWRLAAGLLGIIVLGLLAWQILSLRVREPEFEGRRLSDWMYHHVPSSAAIPPYGSPGWMKSEEALRAIGTNAIPTLLRMIQAQDPPALVLRSLETATRRRWLGINYRRAQMRREEASYCFQLLGPSASNAVPELVGILGAGVSSSSQECVVGALAEIGPSARAALPALLSCFSHTNDMVRSRAVYAVCRVGGDPGTLIPALARALKDPNVGVRWSALVSLSTFHDKARPVLDVILEMRNDTGMLGSTPITHQVETTLWHVAPEKVGKIIVVEEATPIIVNGRTVQDIRFILLGERKTLIPAGKAIPAIAQYWDSDPRPYVTIYRSDSAKNEYCLGRFEVLGLPPTNEPTRINVSTLCMVAEGKILLSARDNNRYQFLEIRRLPDDALK